MVFMDERTRYEAEQAREAARQLLRAYRLAHPRWDDDRTPVDEIAAWLNLDIETFHPDDYPRGTYGFLEPQERLVWLCRDLSPTLRRFTLAHELGHAVLHRAVGDAVHPILHEIDTALRAALTGEEGATREDPCQVQDVREEITGLLRDETAEELLGPGVTYDPHSQRELAANIFAAELLMPLERVRDLYLAQDIPAPRLATLFDVSNAALLNRLAGLLMDTASRAGKNEGDASVHAPVEMNDRGDASVHAPRDAGSRGDASGNRGDASVPSQPYTTPAPTMASRYDEFQGAAIEARTPALIVAGPGSGKTSTLIGRVAYLTREQGVEPRHILALTFSRKAAQEMQERLQSALPPGVTGPTVSTFHAFCAELLREHGPRVGLRPDFAFIDDAEGYFLLRRLASRLPLHHYQNLANPAASFPTILSAISRAKDELATPERYARLAQQMLDEAQDDKEREQAGRAQEIAAIYVLYQEQLARQGDTDFGGLIMLAAQLLREHPDVHAELQERYRHILVDEFQDINRASGVLLRLLAGDARRVWVVGDANQAIYGFRGASPANIANFRDDYPDAVILPLSRNYRSQPDIVNIADAFRRAELEAGTETGKAQAARTSNASPYITLASASDEASELQGVLADIRRKHDEDGYAYRDIVVLCRTRKLARKITLALSQAGLPVIERGGTLEQDHIKNLLSILLLLAEGSGMGILRAARIDEHPFLQADIETLLQTARERATTAQTRPLAQLLFTNDAPPTFSEAGRQSLARLSRILNNLFSATSAWSLIAQYLFLETSIGGRLLTLPDEQQGAALRADYASLLQLARYYDQQQQRLREQHESEARERGEALADATPDIQEQAKGFLDYVSVLLTLRQDAGSRRAGAADDEEAAPDIIRVMTVHASKGLEFPVVYLPGVAKQRFPATRRANPAPLPKGLTALENDEETTHATGEACLFYVGATRARDQLIVSYAESYGRKKYKRSGYIDALATGVPVERIRRIVWHYRQPEQPAGEEENAGDVSVQPSQAFIAAMKPRALHAADIETYQRCPRQYLYSTIYKFRGEAGAYQLFHRATRETLDVLQKKLAALKETHGEHYPTPEEVQELYQSCWQKQEGHTLPFAPMYERHGGEVAELLRRKLLASDDTNWQLHPHYAVEIAGRTIEVTVDRVEHSPADSSAVRFVKTGFGRRKSSVDPGTRELLYAQASRQHHPNQPIELHFHNMSTGDTSEIKLTTRKEQSLYNSLEEALRDMEQDKFPPKPDPIVCPGCPFFLICPA